MTFSASNFTMNVKYMFLDNNKQQIFVSLPPETKRQKNKGARGQIPSNLAIFRHEAPNGACRWSLLELVTGQIHEGRHPT
jgi:hypothetical protein